MSVLIAKKNMGEGVEVQVRQLAASSFTVRVYDTDAEMGLPMFGIYRTADAAIAYATELARSSLAANEL